MCKNEYLTTQDSTKFVTEMSTEKKKIRKQRMVKKTRMVPVTEKRLRQVLQPATRMVTKQRSVQKTQMITQTRMV